MTRCIIQLCDGVWPHRHGQHALRPRNQWGLAPWLFLLTLALGSAPARAAEIVIGIAAPLSGPQEAEGRALAASIRWAVDAINASAPQDAARLTVTLEDDGCEQSAATTAATRLISAGAALVVGHPCAAAALAAARTYAAAKVLYIATAPRHPDLTQHRAGPTVFRLAGRDDVQGQATGRYLLSAYAGRRIAIVHDRTRYARTLTTSARAELAAAGNSNVPEFGIVASTRDYGETVKGIRAHHAEVIYFAGFPSEAAVLWQQLHAAGTAPDLVGSDALANSEGDLSHIARERALQVRVIQPYALADAPGAEPLRQRLKSEGYQDSVAAVAGYAAVEAWSQAVRAAGSHDVAAVAERLGGASLSTIIGYVSFDRAGDVRLPSFAVTRLDGGKLAAEAVILPRPVSEDESRAPPLVASKQERLPPLPSRNPLRSKQASKSAAPHAR